MPVPAFDPKVIEREPGKFAVAVNVWPYPALPVNVRTTSADGKEWNAWIVFVRVGTGTKTFTPEQAAMLMLPAVRSSAMMLDSIEPNHRKNITCYFRMPQMAETKRIRKAVLELKETRLLQNVAVFFANTQSAGCQPIGVGTVHVPLNEIESVWSVDGGDWCLKLKGQLNAVGPKPVYIPNE